MADVRRPGYEPSDVRPRYVLGVAAVMVATLAAFALGVAALLGVFDSTRTRPPAQAEPPPAPRLQADPIDERRRFEAREAEILGGYGPGAGEGLARVPIKEAMRRLIERGWGDGR